MPKKIVIITGGQPASNPRTVKEANSFADAGCDVTVLYCYWADWAVEKDVEILQVANWKAVAAGGSPTVKRSRYYRGRIKHKLFKMLNATGLCAFGIAERAQHRCYGDLLAKAISIDADWYIGHNLVGLPVAAKAAKANRAQAGFDFEDYHRAESTSITAAMKLRTVYIENKYLKAVSYVSAASPLISEAVQKDHPYLTRHIVTVLNVFPVSQQPAFRIKENEDHSLQLFWFSQTVGNHRGLEEVLRALRELDDRDIFLTVAGASSPEIESGLRSHAGAAASRIAFAGIISPSELINFSARFDVGLATELRRPYNREICLTNKVLTYLLAGNAIILSNTKMQQQFNEVFDVGTLYAHDNIEQIKNCIMGFKDLTFLNRKRKHNYSLAERQLNWEKEFEKLAEIIL